jgi:mannosyltransferase OCH1-like enzyme
LIKFALIILILFAVYLTRDRWVYERLLNSLYITLDDFPPDYAAALRALPNDKELKQYNYSNYPDRTSDTTIPPIIHFIWFKDLYETHTEISDIPSIGSHAPTECQRHNPDFTVNVWNSSAARSMLETNYEWFLNTYDSYTHPIQRVDAIKYFILDLYGGFYLDLDISCRRSLTPLQPFSAWVPRARPLGVNNDALAFRRAHPAVKKMTKMLRVRNKNLLFPYLTIFWSTGPQFTGDILKSYLEEYHGAGHKPYAGANKYPSGKLNDMRFPCRS